MRFAENVVHFIHVMTEWIIDQCFKGYKLTSLMHDTPRIRLSTRMDLCLKLMAIHQAWIQRGRMSRARHAFCLSPVPKYVRCLLTRRLASPPLQCILSIAARQSPLRGPGWGREGRKSTSLMGIRRVGMVDFCEFVCLSFETSVTVVRYVCAE